MHQIYIIMVTWRQVAVSTLSSPKREAAPWLTTTAVPKPKQKPRERSQYAGHRHYLRCLWKSQAKVVWLFTAVVIPLQHGVLNMKSIFRVNDADALGRLFGNVCWWDQSSWEKLNTKCSGLSVSLIWNSLTSRGTIFALAWTDDSSVVTIIVIVVTIIVAIIPICSSSSLFSVARIRRRIGAATASDATIVSAIWRTTTRPTITIGVISISWRLIAAEENRVRVVATVTFVFKTYATRKFVAHGLQIVTVGISFIQRWQAVRRSSSALATPNISVPCDWRTWLGS